MESRSRRRAVSVRRVVKMPAPSAVRVLPEKGNVLRDGRPAGKGQGTVRLDVAVRRQGRESVPLAVRFGAADRVTGPEQTAPGLAALKGKAFAPNVLPEIVRGSNGPPASGRRVSVRKRKAFRANGRAAIGERASRPRRGPKEQSASPAATRTRHPVVVAANGFPPAPPIGVSPTDHPQAKPNGALRARKSHAVVRDASRPRVLSRMSRAEIGPAGLPRTPAVSPTSPVDFSACPLPLPPPHPRRSPVSAS